jgi:nicotinamide phosphoribosyltransferase
MNIHNLIFTLDSYKDLHGDMLVDGTEHVYSYGEARTGAMYDYTIFFGLQYIIKNWLEGQVITKELIDEAEPILKEHFKYSGDVWDRSRWDYIANELGGKLPIEIRAIQEGVKVPVSTPLFTIVDTDGKCGWLTNALETLIQQVWYPTTVATRSHFIHDIIRKYFKETVDDQNQWLADYYLHDFGQRGATCMEAAMLGGMAHLINGKGTDTKMGMVGAIKYYDAKIDGIGHSVPASEHSIATQLGKEGEFKVAKMLMKKFHKGILSLVGDSYGITHFVHMICTELKDDVLARDGKLVIRPDSPRFKGDTPQDQILWIVQELDKAYGHTINSKGYKVLHPKVGVIYGDSLTEKDIENSLETLKINGYSAESSVYGCGGYLLQKLNRDTQRFAIKSSAQFRNGKWHDVFKSPSDTSKASKKGRLAVEKNNDEWRTIPFDSSVESLNQLKTVFLNGSIVANYTFDQIRETVKSQ